MRKILYSPGFGAGWTSWFHGSKAAKKFMLEYKPFIEFLENGGKICTKQEFWTDTYKESEIVKKFLQDFEERFPEEEAPFLGGLRDIAIYKVPDNCLVMIHEYDGSESVSTKESIEDQWL